MQEDPQQLDGPGLILVLRATALEPSDLLEQIQLVADTDPARHAAALAECMLDSYLRDSWDPLGFALSLRKIDEWIREGWLNVPFILEMLSRHRIHPLSMATCITMEDDECPDDWIDAFLQEGTTASEAVGRMQVGDTILLGGSYGWLSGMSRIEGRIVALDSLWVKDSPSLEVVKADITCFGRIRVFDCKSLRGFSATCRSLEPPEVDVFGSFIWIDGCPLMESLVNLELGDNSSLYVGNGRRDNTWPPTTLKASGREVKVSGLHSLRTLGRLEGHFSALEVENCPALESLPSSSFSAHRAELRDCPNLRTLGGLSRIEGILRVHRVPGIEKVLRKLDVERAYEGCFEIPKD